jgi:hypothetical protein
MTTSAIDTAALASLVDAHGLSSVLGTPDGLKSASTRLGAFFDSYSQHRAKHGRASSLPASQDWGALLHQASANPHRVQVLLQALSFVVSPGMLAMLWMVQLGASVKELHLTHERENATRLTVVLDLPGEGSATETFVSTEHWDLALLHLASLTKVDEQPVISGFAALKLPNS